MCHRLTLMWHVYVLLYKTIHIHMFVIIMDGLCNVTYSYLCISISKHKFINKNHCNRKTLQTFDTSKSEDRSLGV